LIVTADDFGLSDNVNDAIIEALQRGLVTHASVMANMPAFDRACALARERAVVDRLGVHLVLTEGPPLTEAIRACERFCDPRGRFRYWRASDRAFHLSRVERHAVAVELREQVMRCRQRGLPITHLDSHHHVHTKRAIGQIVTALARAEGVPRVRLAHNCGTRIHFANRLYKAWYNKRLKRAGFAHTRWLGNLDDYRYLKTSGVPLANLESFELVTHPSIRNGILIDADYPERPLEQLLA
jgi:predicted glycoside hydrolase/deacetylase ChbG (UPF0249 family)